MELLHVLVLVFYAYEQMYWRYQRMYRLHSTRVQYRHTNKNVWLFIIMRYGWVICCYARDTYTTHFKQKKKLLSNVSRIRVPTQTRMPYSSSQWNQNVMKKHWKCVMHTKWKWIFPFQTDCEIFFPFYFGSLTLPIIYITT